MLSEKEHWSLPESASSIRTAIGLLGFTLLSPRQCARVTRIPLPIRSAVTACSSCCADSPIRFRPYLSVVVSVARRAKARLSDSVVSVAAHVHVSPRLLVGL